MGKTKDILKIAFTSFVITVIMLLFWWLLMTFGESARLWRALLINFLFFTSFAAGLVVWPSIVVSAHGKWMGRQERICWTGLSFSLPSIAILVLLWVNAGAWAPWLEHNHAEWWLDTNFLFLRNILFLMLFWIMAFWTFSKRNSPNIRKFTGVTILTYAISFSLIGFDFVMTLKHEWYSMMMGGYFFVSGVYIAAAAWAFMAILVDKPEKNVLHDMGKLIIAFCMITSYLMFSQLFPIWYANIPHETSFLVPRMNYAWKTISYLLLAMVYIGPLIVLLPSSMKKNPLTLGAVSFIILIGMWIERWWLVSAVFEKENVLFGWSEALSTLIFLAIVITGIVFVLPAVSSKFKQEELSYER